MMREKYKRLIISGIFLLIAVSIVSFTIGDAVMQDKQPDLVSFASIHFSGYLFFIILPVEALVPYYLSEGHSGVLLILIAVLTALVAQVLDYSFGFTFSEKIIDNFIGRRRYSKAKTVVEKYGGWAIFFFNLFPLSSPILLLAAGMLRFKLSKALLYSAAGLIIKYTVIVLVVRLF
ncbi:DedA family protein [Bacteroidota bacterium]